MSTKPELQPLRSGKVREIYAAGDNLIIVSSDRISAFDVILPRPIPHKGQVLNQVAAKMLQATKDICPNWLLNTPAPNVSIGKKCIPFKIEMVVRGNLVGHAWRTYSSGKRELCGAIMEEGLQENDYFKLPIITPSTKADAGHDEDISPQQIIATGLATEAQWQQLSMLALQLFERGKHIAQQHQLILADTKYEFGICNNEIYLMDEVHTPDSSRYFYADGFNERQATGEKQKQLSKEFVREWLMENNFMGKEGQQVPTMSDEWVHTISQRYIELYEKVTGEKFTPQPLSDEETYTRIAEHLQI